MASDPQFDDQYDEFGEPQPRPPQKKGMSTGVKVIIILACSIFGIMLVCCGVGYFLVVYPLQNAASNDPTVIAEVTEEIAEIDIPPGYRPKMSLNLKIADSWLLRQIPDMQKIDRIRFVVYDTGTEKGVFILMEIVGEEVRLEQFGKAQEQQMRRQMEQQQGDQKMRRVNVQDSEIKVFKIRGKKRQFTLAKGVDQETKQTYRQVSGTFAGKSKNAVVFFMLQVPEDQYKEAEVVKMIKSIK